MNCQNFDLKYEKVEQALSPNVNYRSNNFKGLNTKSAPSCSVTNTVVTQQIIADKMQALVVTSHILQQLYTVA